MSRAVWWISVGAALAFTVWVWATWTMAEVSLACSKTGESGSSFRCDDRIIRVLGVWPLIGLGLLLATPLVVAALAMRKWVSWLAVAALVGLSIAGLANWSSFWGSLLFAVPLAALGLVAAATQKAIPRPGTPQNREVLRQRLRRRAPKPPLDEPVVRHALAGATLTAFEEDNEVNG